MLPSAVVQHLPTPTTQDAANNGGPSQLERNTPPLNAVVNTLLPTPLAQDAKHGGVSDSRHGRNSYELSGLPALLPTPTAWEQRSDPATDDRNLLPLAVQRMTDEPAEPAPPPVPPGQGSLLPTPEASDGSGGRRSAELGGTRPSGSKRAVTLATAVDHHLAGRDEDALLPTPVTDPDSANGHARDLGSEARLLPTPVATDALGARNETAYRDPERQGGHSGTTLTDVAWKMHGHADERLLPTPRSAADRTGKTAALRQDSMSGPSLGQAVEIAQGVLPHEFDSWEDLPESWQPGDALLPTPNDFHMGNTETPEEWLERRADVEERTGTRHGPALPVIAHSIHDGTPLVQDGSGPKLVTAGADRWGPYAAAIHRWEQTLGRRAPDPTQLSTKGTPQLSARFAEWMMGLPDGWVVDVPDITRNEALKALGNGVVPAQAAAALRIMAGWSM